MSEITLGFLPKPLLVPIDNLLPSRTVGNGPNTLKYRQIKASIEEIDLIEPLSVTPVDRKTGHHTVLDGNLRLLAMRDLGRTVVPCLIAVDDEFFTYNNRLTPLSTVQQHMMIRQAIERGVAAERLANVMCMPVSQILDRANLLDGICREAIEMLKDRHFSIELSKVLRRMVPIRQVECVELMQSANNFTVAYGRALQSTTPAEMLVGKAKIKLKRTGISQEQITRMEREIGSVQSQYKLAEQSYGEDMLNLVMTRGYVEKLIENTRVVRFLEQKHAELLTHFRSLVETTSVDAWQS